MIGATLGNILDGSHHIKDTAKQFSLIVIDNRLYKDKQAEAYRNVLTKALLKSFHAVYFVASLPSIINLVFSLRGCTKKTKKFFRKPVFSIKDHLDYAATRNLLDSLNKDLSDIKVMYNNLAQRQFPLKKLVLTEFSTTINILENYIHSAEGYLKKFNKPVLAKHGNKVLPEAKQWKSRVKAYDFIA